VRRSGLGENFIFTNRQFAAANVWGNNNHTNYHSLQAQVTLRPTHGLNFQTTYTWSRNLGNRDAITDPLNRAADYGVLGNHRSHMLTTYGTYNLPLGPSGYAFRDSSGWVRRLVEGWQLSWVTSITSGLPYSVTSVNSMYGGAMVDLVNPDCSTRKAGMSPGNPVRAPAVSSGICTRRWMIRSVPGFRILSFHLFPRIPFEASANQSQHSLLHSGRQDSLQHTQPGVRGTSTNSLTGPGRWSWT
jgi:hypothetical protein